MLTHGKYLLDTCVCIALIKNQYGLRERIREIDPMDCKISEITRAELLFGAVKSGREKHFDDVREICSMFEEVEISGCLQEYAEIRWELERTGQKIDSLDLLIGATAVAEKYILVTGNVKHFERIPGLRIENWMEG